MDCTQRNLCGTPWERVSPYQRIAFIGFAVPRFACAPNPSLYEGFKALRSTSETHSAEHHPVLGPSKMLILQEGYCFSASIQSRIINYGSKPLIRWVHFEWMSHRKPYRFEDANHQVVGDLLLECGPLWCVFLHLLFLRDLSMVRRSWAMGVNGMNPTLVKENILMWVDCMCSP